MASIATMSYSEMLEAILHAAEVRLGMNGSEETKEGAANGRDHVLVNAKASQ